MKRRKKSSVVFVIILVMVINLFPKNVVIRAESIENKELKGVNSFVIKYNENGKILDEENNTVGKAGEYNILCYNDDREVKLELVPNNDEIMISEIKVDDRKIKLNNENLHINEKGNYVYTFREITEDHSIEVNFKEIETIEDNENKYYGINYDENLVNSYEDTNGYNVYKFSSAVGINIVPKEPYDKFKVVYENGTCSEYVGSLYIYENTIIKSIVLEKEVVDDYSEKKIRVNMKPIKIINDNEAPKIEKLKKEPNLDVTNSKVIISGVVSDNEKVVKTVRYSDDYNEYVNDTLENNFVNNCTIDNYKFSFEVSNNESINKNFYIWCYDDSGNKSECKSTFVSIDVEEPIVKSVNTDYYNKWSKDKVTISGEVIDEFSGISEVRYSNSLEDYNNDTYELKKCSLAEVKGNNYSFTIKSDKSIFDEYYVWAYDKVGNKSNNYKKVLVKLDKEPPVIESIIKEPKSKWSNNVVKIKIKASDDFKVSGIKYNTINDISSAKEINEEKNEFEITSEVDKDGNPINFTGKYYVWAKDEAENYSKSSSIDVNVDVTNPYIKSFEISKKNDSIFSKAINFLTFGTFFNESVDIKVKVSDGKGAGVESVTLYGDGEEIDTKKVIEDEEVAFNVELPFNKVISAKVTDKVNNSSEIIEATKLNTKIKNNALILENEKPIIEIKNDVEKYNDNANLWFDSNVNFEANIFDEESGLKYVKISVNNKILIDEKLDNKKNSSVSYNFSTDNIEVNEDGSYEIIVESEDNSGNYTKEQKKVYKDDKNPFISGVKFKTKDNLEIDGSIVEEKAYGYYFKDDVTVNIFAQDEGASSGIKDISFYTIDENNNKSEVNTIDVNDNNEISFTIPANFKGEIYAKASDNVNNSEKEYLRISSIIVENNNKHDENSNILITMPKATFSDNNKVDLYNNDVNVNLEVSDCYSGIKTVEVLVESEFDKENNINEKLEIDNNGILTGSEGWKIDSIEENLVTKVSKEIVVKNNSNNIKLKIILTDRSGNTTIKEKVFSIDKSSPEICVNFDNNDYNAEYVNEEYYFNNSRTATIRIKERNFNINDVDLIVKNLEGDTPVLSQWVVETQDDQNPDNNVYVATLVFNKDGNYELFIGYKDLANNIANHYDSGKFIIDMTNPNLNLSFNNNSSMNNNFYNKAREASISIVDHNFDSSKVVISGVASNKDKNITFPTISSWKSEGDKHTATLVFSNDGEYSFNVQYTDKAGNKGNILSEDSFCIDTTSPQLEISGIRDKSANKDKVTPKISYSDDNFDKDSVNIKLTGANRGNVKLEGLQKEKEFGGEFIFYDFKEEKDIDDLYTLEVTLKDKAGNESKQSIEFSVNRFGSIYAFNEELINIKGKYVNKPVDVKVSEINVDKLNEESIGVKVTKNGTSFDLEKGKDFMITNTGGNGSWNRYEYSITPSIFSDDGVYILTIYSEDAAGNINENSEESNEAEAWFGIDKTSPVIIPIDLKSNEKYRTNNKEVDINISDNLVLNNVYIYLNEKKIDYISNGEEYSFDIKNLDSKQNLKIVSTDMAGNKTIKSINNFYVTTNWFMYISSNFIIVSLIIAIAVAFVVIIVVKKKRGGKINV